MAVQEMAKPVGDVLAVSTVIGTLLQLLPHIAALFAIIWYSMGAYEKITGRPFSQSWVARKITRK